jgi:hypothetical protein
MVRITIVKRSIDSQPPVAVFATEKGGFPKEMESPGDPSGFTVKIHPSSAVQ